jgi:hypothetical protein
LIKVVFDLLGGDGLLSSILSAFKVSFVAFVISLVILAYNDLCVAISIPLIYSCPKGMDVFDAT